MLKQHRTLATTLHTLIDTGFDLRRIAEFAPTREPIEMSLRAARWLSTRGARDLVVTPEGDTT